ncbi:hypothetical protein [Alloscardovia macacae]|uniref:Glycosyltransferase RgtA/B/C/D-like domain-containing protein n=1 Tax=Alloscardovia macacae TaxID=1160091 RepID=A0A261F6J3_9BIFI|nr:hypothetical protein [Alloscardovia macacae]OZG54516.1 hypothetical protein ALMA_0977 [Alloscardovia macacae]
MKWRELTFGTKREQESRPARAAASAAPAPARAASARAARFLASAAYALTGLTLTFLLTLSLIFTVLFVRAGEAGDRITERVDYNPATPAGFALFLALTAVTAIALLLAIDRLRKVPRRRLLIGLLIWVLVAQILWIVAIGLVAYSYPDSRSLMDAAHILVTGDTAKFSPEYCPRGGTDPACLARKMPSPYNYFRYYPFQAGPALWYVIIFALFGSYNVVAFQVVSAVAITGLVAVLWRMGAFIGLNQTGFAAFSVLVGTCAPLLLFCAFVYPNAVGFAITMAGAWLIAEGVRGAEGSRSLRHIATLVAGFLVCGIGITFKSTFQILLLAVLAALFVAVLATRQYWQFGFGLLGAFGALRLSQLPTVLLEHWVGQRFGRGLPTISWIAIGLGSREGRGEGWWTGFALRAFNDTQGSYAAQSEISRQFIRERIESFSHAPGEAAGFFTRKLASEWAEPTFMTELYSKHGTSWSGFHGPADFLLTGAGSGAFLGWQDIMQCLVYVFALVGVGALLWSAGSSGVKAHALFTRMFLTASFLGGFLCFIFWEAKGIYTLPFFILLLPLAALGMQVVSQRVQAFLSARSVEEK